MLIEEEQLHRMYNSKRHEVGHNEVEHNEVEKV